MKVPLTTTAEPLRGSVRTTKTAICKNCGRMLEMRFQNSREFEGRWSHQGSGSESCE